MNNQSGVKPEKGCTNMARNPKKIKALGLESTTNCGIVGSDCNIRVEPTGPIWEAAKAESNWLVYRLEPRLDGKKPIKVPMHTNGYATAFQKAARHTQSQALDYARELGENHDIGYLPREGSAMICVDLDEVLLPEGLQPDLAHLMTSETFVERSPSGKGLHILCARDGWPTMNVDGTADPVGIISNGSRWFTVSLKPYGDPRPVARAPVLRELLQPQILAWSKPKPDVERAASRHGWFDDLDPEEQEACAEKMLGVLPLRYRDDRPDWLNITFALRRYPNTHAAWDRWSMGSPAYNAAKNLETWDDRERREGIGAITIGTLIALAQEEGLDLGPWKRRAEKARAKAVDSKSARLATRLREGSGMVAEMLARPFVEPPEEVPPYEGREDQWEPVGAACMREKPDALPMIVEGLMPMAPMTILGTGGTRKTTIVLMLMIRIALGLDLWGYKVVKPGRCLLITGEDDLVQCRFRLHHVAKGMGLTQEQVDIVGENLAFFDATTFDARLLRPNKDQDLETTIFAEGLISSAEAWQPSAVFIDPTSAFGPGERFVNDGASGLMQLAHAISKAGKCATVFLHHVSKAAARGGMDDQHAGRGGSALADNARAVWVFTVPTTERPAGLPPEVHDEVWQDERLISINVAKMSYAARPRGHLYVVVKDGEFAFDMVEGMAPARGANQNAQDDAAVYLYIFGQWQKERLTERSLTSATIQWQMPDGQSSAALGPTRIKRALQRLKDTRAVLVNDDLPKQRGGAKNRLEPAELKREVY